jgi:hypothetical protein
VEAKPALGIANVHPIEDQAVEMHVESQRGIRALNEGHRADLRVLDRAQAQLPLGPPSKRATHGADERREHVRAQPLVIAHRVAQAPRQRAHPLPHGDLGQDFVDEVGGEVGHAPAEAGGAEPAALARERHNPRMATAPTRKVSEAVLEQAAAQVGVELVDDKLRQTPRFLGPGAEARPVALEQLVEKGLVRTAALVAVQASSRRRRGHSHESSARAAWRCAAFELSDSAGEVARIRATIRVIVAMREGTCKKERRSLPSPCSRVRAKLRK